MTKFISRRFLFPIIAFLLLDLLAVGLGMGVPFFAILFGFVVGWFAPLVLSSTITEFRRLLRKCLMVAFLTPILTFLIMLIIWGPSIRMLFDPSADIANFGIPMILYEPKASFIGWIVLMIIISPLLQCLTTGFSTLARLAWFPPAAFREPKQELKGKGVK